jgi:hypothetical protein
MLSELLSTNDGFVAEILLNIDKISPCFISTLLHLLKVHYLVDSDTYTELVRKHKLANKKKKQQIL